MFLCTKATTCLKNNSLNKPDVAIGCHMDICLCFYTQDDSGGKVNILGVIVSVIVGKNVHLIILNNYRERAV